jgi:hypothetical protein
MLLNSSRRPGCLQQRTYNATANGKDRRTTWPLARHIYSVLLYDLLVFQSACCKSSQATSVPVISSVSTYIEMDYDSGLVYGSIAGGTK